jgi:hypothetical protein
MAFATYNNGVQKVYEVEGTPSFDEIKELLAALNIETGDQIQIELVGCLYTFRTNAELKAWNLGFEASWDLMDELMNPYSEEDE